MCIGGHEMKLLSSAALLFYETVFIDNGLILPFICLHFPSL